MKRNLIVAAVTAAALLTGGTAAAFAASADEEAPAQARHSAPKVTAEQALKSVAGHGTVVSLDLDDDGATTWDVEVLTKDGKVQEWTVDATTAKATQDQDDHQDQDDDQDQGQDD
ncbi:PepSY domain-containing protein [Streptomyces sp. NPDC006307]|uniref:PepSY domain-containing protein n=1 Tax=Streptomyces sp. NPDC006307 TaxID=3156748 RepID=UPI0033BA644B